MEVGLTAENVATTLIIVQTIKYSIIKKYQKYKEGTVLFLKWKSTEKNSKILNF